MASEINDTHLQDQNHNTLLSGATRLDCQVAGHSAKKGRALDFMRHKDGYVLKPICNDKVQGRREIQFYEELEKDCDPISRELKKFTPKYFGTTEIKVNSTGIKWLILKNAAHGFREPCIMDIKVGSRTWDPLASEEKRLSEEAKYRDCKRDLGFCIPGFQMYKLPTGELVRKDREFGKSLNGTTARNAIRTFLNGEFGLSRTLLLQFLGKLWRILRWFRTQKNFRFYSSSLLLVYDAATLKQIARVRGLGSKAPMVTIGRQINLRVATGPLTPGFREGTGSRTPGPGTPAEGPSVPGDRQTTTDNVCKTHSLVSNYDRDLQSMKDNYKVVFNDFMNRTEDIYEVWVNVNMIDFAHVFHSPTEDVDLNYLNGLQTLVNIFEEFLLEVNF
ncbi:hypothetical protein RUM43_001965 [Polyplax serrata]|uniref:Kinase n=1 Tax=Polyplax serrata TaxID=468196 RepID=A0AAN8PBW4_POLSC